MKAKFRGKSDLPRDSKLNQSDPPTSEQPIQSVPIPSLQVKRILVPLDFSECSLSALDYALALALKLGATVSLLHVVEPTIVPQDQFSISSALNDVSQNLVAACRERLSAISAKKLGHCVTDETLVRLGHAHSEITDTAKALGVNMIVLGTHGTTGLKHLLLGGTAEHVVRHAHCPVLTIRVQGCD
jgi:nucleotide-binding universal stress UspA family protein